MNPAVPTFERQGETPLFPNILWNRPVSRRGAGRILLPGGHSGDFTSPTLTYQAMMAAGAGECVVALPDSLVKTLGGLPSTTFLASSTSGSLGQEGLGRLIELSEEADAVALGASLSNNSHTSILLERFLREQPRPIIAFADAYVSLQHSLKLLADNPQALLIATMPEVFKLASALRVPITIRPGGGLVNKLEIIRDVAAASQCSYVVYGSELVVASEGKLGVTPFNYRLGLLPPVVHGTLSVFWTQNRAAPYAGLMTGSYVLSRTGATLAPDERPSINALTRTVAKLLDEAF